MTVAEIWEQAKALSRAERQQLLVLLIESMDVPEIATDKTREQTLERLLDTFHASDWERLGIENPVAWIEQHKR